MSYQPAFAPTGIRVSFRAPPPANPARIPVNASVGRYHKLWYLGLCAKAGISVVSYRDEAEATMIEAPNGAGRFASATLRPRIIIRTGGDIVAAAHLHHEAHAYCFIANSVNFPIACEPSITTA